MPFRLVPPCRGPGWTRFELCSMHNTTAEDLEVRVKADPFVAEDVVTAEIIEITPGAADERLAFLLP